MENIQFGEYMNLEGHNQVICSISQSFDGKNLVSSDNQYSYLFKFVIKAKDGEEELIYQPAVFNVKLMGAKKI